MEHSSPNSSAHDDDDSLSAQDAHHSPSPSQACPVAPRQDCGNNVHSCIVDHDRQPFEVTWWGFPELPDLTKFPDLAGGAAVSPVPQSPTLAAVWQDSSALDFGCYASVRRQRPRSTDDDDDIARRCRHCPRGCAHDHAHARFPVLKLAHPDPRALDLLEREFSILCGLRGRGLPVPNVDPRPIMDGERVQGYRMEELRKLERGELQARQRDVRRALERLHAAGFCHGDVNPGNVMKDGNGEIVLIDFGFAGRIGDEVPPLIPTWVYTSGTFAAEDDLTAFDEFIVI